MPKAPPVFKKRERKPWADPGKGAAKRIRGRKGVELRKRRLLRTSHLCEHCLEQGIKRIATIVNHKLPLAHGGEDVDENTENLCTPCDEIATAKQFGRTPKRRISVDGWPEQG
jgi:5-methylcytosine-specific restriction endonuclease McrA